MTCDQSGLTLGEVIEILNAFAESRYMDHRFNEAVDYAATVLEALGVPQRENLQAREAASQADA